MLSDPWFYAVAIPAMVILGLSKGGFTSMGMLAVPILSLVISPIQAAGITLPVLVLSDIIAVISYWGVFDRKTLLIMLPGATVGIFLAYLTATWVTDNEIRLIVGAISVLFALNYWFRHRLRQHAEGQNVVKGTFWAILTGFTSFVSHAGAPPFQMYVVPLRLEPRLFAGTSVLVFAIINAVKTVPYFLLGQFDLANLTLAAVLLPVAIPFTFVGVWLVKRFEAESFYRIIYWMIFLVGVYLVFESVAIMLRGAGASP